MPTRPILLVILWLASIVATGLVARHKRRLVRSWVAGAVFTAYVALILVSVLPAIPEAGQEPEALAMRIDQLERQLAAQPNKAD